MASKKLAPAGKAEAKKSRTLSDQKLQKASLKVRGQPEEGPGIEFWLKTDDTTGEELAFELEPELPHLTVQVVRDDAGRELERTWTRTKKVRMNGGPPDFITPKPGGWKAPGGWVAHELPKTETHDTFGVWQRPLTRGWRLLSPEEAYSLNGSKPWRQGKVWRRLPPAKGDES